MKCNLLTNIKFNLFPLELPSMVWEILSKIKIWQKFVNQDIDCKQINMHIIPRFICTRNKYQHTLNKLRGSLFYTGHVLVSAEKIFCSAAKHLGESIAIARPVRLCESRKLMTQEHRRVKFHLLVKTPFDFQNTISRTV